MEFSAKGVFKASKKNGSTYYRASITYQNKHISLGSFELPENAECAYKEADILLHTPTILLSDYNDSKKLSFEKWVSLTNYRDNHYYINVPIYLYPKYFEYYISQDYVLKFSIDDLFFYSKRKIMKRGNHLFVSDYGMQMNLLNRYGIRSHAVEGRDYIFINGDNLDYRYENIKIINKYFGVTSKMTKSGIKFTAKIHIKGNYTIGTYSKEEYAAIAYNKAIDILKKNGIKKNFIPNYIDNLRPSEYANIYSEIIISPKIENYKE